ncbi:MAG TPA: type II and III secretion system protein family protein [Steroidobacteraceae bacterium]|nr:type II and III secretion system protein family protein [Steroidobacteraceae bacterium]
MRHTFATRVVLALLAALLFPGSASAADGQQSSDQVVRATRNTSVEVPVYKSRIVELPDAAKRVSIGNPDIADVLLLRANELYILGKDLGTTNVMLWDRSDALISAIAVTVTHDLDGLRARLATLLPSEKIEVVSARRNIILSGQVTSLLRMDAALQIARGYLEQAGTAKEKIMFKQENATGHMEDRTVGEVINLMSISGAQQVMLQVRVAEVRRDAVKHLNAQYNAILNKGKWVGGGVNGGATFPNANWVPPQNPTGSNLPNGPVPMLGSPGLAGGSPVGPNQTILNPTLPIISNAGLFGSFISNQFLANVVLDAFQQQGLAKILAEPTLMTQTGQEAQFLSGGSFPIPVPEQNGVIGIDYKDFGVKLVFQPLVLESGRINLKLNISVSELVQANSLVVTPISSSGVFAVPALTERRAISTVELADGQTIGIAGLMDESMRNAINKFPGLGDIPILGALFRSQDFQKNQTELVILVTPRLAQPMSPADARLPTDSVVEPSNLDFFLRGRIEGTSPSPGASPVEGQPHD